MPHQTGVCHLEGYGVPLAHTCAWGAPIPALATAPWGLPSQDAVTVHQREEDSSAAARGYPSHVGGTLLCLVLAGTDLDCGHHLNQKEFLRAPRALRAVGPAARKLPF